MAIYFYSRECNSCSGNHALDKMKQVCKKQGVDFQERRTILWERFEQEADEIMELNEGLKLPFFYFEGTGAVLKGDSLTPLDTIEKWLDKCLKS